MVLISPNEHLKESPFFLKLNLTIGYLMVLKWLKTTVHPIENNGYT